MKTEITLKMFLETEPGHIIVEGERVFTKEDKNCPFTGHFDWLAVKTIRSDWFIAIFADPHNSPEAWAYETKNKHKLLKKDALLIVDVPAELLEKYRE